MYKVVIERDCHRYFSCSGEWVEQENEMYDYLVEYKVGEKTHPRPSALKAGYGLCFFKELGDAVTFARLNETREYPTRIFSVLVGKIFEELPVFGQDALLITIGNEWWVGNLEDHGWPDGTYMTDSIELIKEVPLSEIIKEALDVPLYTIP